MYLELSKKSNIIIGAKIHSFHKTPKSDNSFNYFQLTHKSVTDLGYIDFKDLPQVYDQTSSEFERYLIQPGDIILLTKGSYIKSGFVDAADLDNKKVIIPNSMMIIRCQTIQLAKLIHIYLNTPEGKEKRVRLGGNAPIKSVSKKELEKLLIPIPPEHLQEQVIELAETNNQAFLDAQKYMEIRYQYTNAQILKLLQSNAHDH